MGLNIYDDKRYTKVRMFVHTHGENVCSESYLSEIFSLNACQVFAKLAKIIYFVFNDLFLELF